MYAEPRGVEIVAICDANPEMVEHTEKAAGNIEMAADAVDLRGVRIYRDFERMLSKEKLVDVKDVKHIPKKDIPKMIIELDLEMREAADSLNFEKAIFLRDKINRLKQQVEISKVR